MNRHQEKLEKNEKVDSTNSPKFKIKSVVSDGLSENGTMIPAETKLRRHNPLRCRSVKKYTRTVENEMVKFKIKLPGLKKQLSKSKNDIREDKLKECDGTSKTQLGNFRNAIKKNNRTID